MKIDLLMAKVNKKFGNSSIGLAKDSKFIDVSRITSGSLFLDWALGQNGKDKTSGWPLGKIIELYGPESAGKSLISMKTVAKAQKDGLFCVYFDCEGGFDKGFAEKLGVDVDSLLLSRETEGEKVIEMACELLESKRVDVIVFDSLAAMIPKTEIEDPLEQVQMAPMARLMSKALRKLNHKNENTLIIFINQLRVNPGARYGNPEYTPGGRALKFYASLRVEVRKGDWIIDPKDKKKKVGQIIKFKVVKNKTDVPLKVGSFKFLYSGEIDKADELVSLGLLNKKIDRKGAYYYVGDESFQGRDDLESKLKEDEKLFDVAKKLVFHS